RGPDLLLRLLDARLEQRDLVGEHLLIELVADFLDVTRLLVAEQIARAAHIEIVARELEAGAQRVQRLQHVETLLRLRRDRAVRRRREQGVGPRLAAANAATQLIELAKPEHVGAPDDQSVGVGNVETGFDDARREQDVVFTVIEGGHLLFELAWRQLAVRDHGFRLRRILAQEGRGLLEVLDPRADEKGLAAAKALSEQRLANDQRIEGRDEAPHGEPVDRRRRDQRQFAHARHGELQRARNGRRRERQHVHFGAQLLQALLVADAEML